MSELIEKIKLFHAIKLQPISKKKRRMWDHEIEKNLIFLNNIKECYIKIDRLEMMGKEAGSIKNRLCERVKKKQQPQPCERVLRWRGRKKKNMCCTICQF